MSYNYCIEHCGGELCNYLDCKNCPTWIENNPEENEIPYSGAFPWEEQDEFAVHNNTPKECPGGDTWYMYEYEYALVKEALVKEALVRESL